MKKYLSIITVILFFGCTGRQNNNSDKDASAHVIVGEELSGDEKTKSANAVAATSNATLNTLMNLLNDTPYGVEEFLTTNGFMQLSNPHINYLKTFQFKADTTRIIHRSFGIDRKEKYVSYFFRNDELFSSVKNQAMSFGFTYVNKNEENGITADVYTNETHELQLSEQENGTYNVLLRSK